jgi:DNA (cytosine-5)-methyltransferase 1
MSDSTHREIWSLFSGAMGLDIGLEQAGLKVTLACEIEKTYCNTIRLNRPSLSLIEGDVAVQTVASLRAARNGYSGEVFLLAGGPPCQSYSSGGKRQALGDPRGGLVKEFFRLVGEVQPKYFIMENVANLATAALEHRPIDKRPGKRWSLKSYEKSSARQSSLLDDGGAPPLRPEEMAGSAIRALISDVIMPLGYHVRFGVLDAADFGAPQHRLRLVMLGSRDWPPPELPTPTHGSGLQHRVTVRDAIWHMQNAPGQHSAYTPEMARFFELVPEGGNWRDLPSELHREALGGAADSGGGKTGFFRRLAWDRPSCTMTGKANRKATAVCHPTQTRPISAKECAALQGFPESWSFSGATGQQFMQAGNAVPVALGKAVGASIVAHETAPRNRVVLPQTQGALDAMLEASMTRLRAAGANNKSKNAALLRKAAL